MSHGGKPVKVQDQHKRHNWYARANAWLAIKITDMVGSMTCAWLFAAWAIWGLPVALQPGNIGLQNWFAEEFCQFVLLSIIMVGQNIQAKAADARSIQTYDDTEAIKTEVRELREMLAAALEANHG